jgi:hypothetical protein
METIRWSLKTRLWGSQNVRRRTADSTSAEITIYILLKITLASIKSPNLARTITKNTVFLQEAYIFITIGLMCQYFTGLLIYCIWDVPFEMGFDFFLLYFDYCYE